jgi:hypothetical protein
MDIKAKFPTQKKIENKAKGFSGNKNPSKILQK